MKPLFLKIWNLITTLLVAAVMLLAAVMWGPRLVGMDVYTVLSGSMEPEYPTGGLIYIKETDPMTLENGDVITFRMSGDTIATHRIVEILEENGTRAFRTKGDANDVVDNGLVEPGRILGKVLLCIPQMGFLAAYIQSTSGRYAAMAVGALLLLLLVLPDLLFPKTKTKENAR